MAFEVFDFENVVSSSSPNIRIGEKSIVFNKAFLNLLKTTKVELAYDTKSKTIRIKSVGENDKGIQIDRTKINAFSFLQHFKIEQRGHFESKYDEKEQAFYVKI